MAGMSKGVAGVGNAIGNVGEGLQALTEPETWTRAYKSSSKVVRNTGHSIGKGYQKHIGKPISRTTRAMGKYIPPLKLPKKPPKVVRNVTRQAQRLSRVKIKKPKLPKVKVKVKLPKIKKPKFKW
jgi:hypothetical protein